MNIITVDGITKAYGERKVFDNASFYLAEGEKAGIIGINGTGKSTLLKIIAGLESPDSGQIICANGKLLRYLPQSPEFQSGDTVLQAVIRENKNQLNQWTIESDAKNMLTKLGVTNFEEKCDHLSGGQKKKLALVSCLMSKADILLLDEPTNHLDGEMSDWLENQLKNYKGSIIMVTHDRYFLDSVSDRIIEIDKGNIYSYEANYSGYLELKAMREDMADASWRKTQSILRTELEWVKRGARARSTKQKARLERYEEMKNMSAPKKDETVLLGSVASRLGKTTIVINNVSKKYGDKELFENFSYNFLKNDRIGIIGPNGCGKSTLLKIMMGELMPDSGEVEVGPTVKIGYFAQLIEDMDPSMRVIDYIREEAEYINTPDGKITAARLLENFLFAGEDQYGLIGKLSGGEKRRLYLCRVLMQAPNVLILDEPTNDLDITTLRVLENYLDTFEGIVVAVSHDRYFLDRVVRRIFAFENGRLCQSEGGYTDYELRKKINSENERQQNDNKQSSSKAMQNNKEEIKDEKKKNVKPKFGEPKLKFTYKEQKEYETIEDDIAKLEERLEELDKLIEKNAKDFVKLQEYATEKEIKEGELAEKMDRWMYLEDLADRIAKSK